MLNSILKNRDESTFNVRHSIKLPSVLTQGMAAPGAENDLDRRSKRYSTAHASLQDLAQALADIPVDDDGNAIDPISSLHDKTLDKIEKLDDPRGLDEKKKKSIFSKMKQALSKK